MTGGFEPATRPAAIVRTESDGHPCAEQARYHLGQAALSADGDYFAHTDSIHARGWHRALDMAGVGEGGRPGTPDGAGVRTPVRTCRYCGGAGHLGPGFAELRDYGKQCVFCEGTGRRSA